MIELRRVVWSWESALARLHQAQPDLAEPLLRSTRPVAAERSPDGGLELVLGSWWRPDFERLGDPEIRRQLEVSLSQVLDDPVRLSVVLWPGVGGEAPTKAPPNPPDTFRGLPPSARQAASSCESMLQRRFFAGAWRRGLRLECQRPVLIYRLDFVVPRTLLGVEILAWKAHATVAGWERVRDLGAEGWRIISFTGEEVYEDVERCIDELEDQLRGSGR